ncbi:MAG TPA: chemotaxis protein CheB [Baekduia sp.]|nr:chemotaxis protein CheB [Baekduia sp.]
MTPQNPAPYRVLVADDSTFMRRVLAQSLAESGFDVVGEAADGDEALALWRELKPDAMTLDLAMPGLDGMGVLRALDGKAASIPIVVVSAFSPSHGARAVDALAEGAFDLVAKPAFGEPIDAFIEELREKVGAAAKSAGPHVAMPRHPHAVQHHAARPDRVHLIVSSTGGPRALGELIPELPSPLGSGGMIVQHMPAGFTLSLSARLDRSSTLGVTEATDGALLAPDTLLMAPGGSHLRLTPDGDGARVQISGADPVGGLRPRADLTIVDAAAIFGERLLLVVLTGMGRDGLLGARAVREAGGSIYVESAETCTVYGMPRVIAEAGLADEELPLSELALAIAEGARA